MKTFITYLKDYYRNTSLSALIITTLFVASLVVFNYRIGIESRFQGLNAWYLSLGAFYLFYLAVLALSYGLQYEWGWKERHPTKPFVRRKLLYLLLLAPFYFALKMVHWDLGSLLPKNFPYPWDAYTLTILQLPLKLLLLFVLLYACRKNKWLEGDTLFESIGLTARNFNARPYFGLLALMIPVIALASTQHDFLLVYPKVRNVAFIDGYAHPAWPWKLLYELSYGLDFLGIELFFRGLLVVAVVRYIGEYAVLPMAAFYCTIHFGKPLGECISSYFGGLILGVLAARTRSIYGGLIVHLGLAWLMEFGGWIGQGYHLSFTL
jgi:hypothetical protein